jgi:GAF domain-containing protein
MEPKTSDLPLADLGRYPTVQAERLLVASRLATNLSRTQTVEEVAGEAVRLLHQSFDYYLAVVQRLDPDGCLRVVAGAGPLAEGVDDFLGQEQPVEVGVNGRVARSGRPAMVNDTRLDSDYLARNPRTGPGSELSLPASPARSCASPAP